VLHGERTPASARVIVGLASRMRWALEYVIKGARGVKLIADGIIRAVRAYSWLQDNGKWVAQATPDRVI
jgi:hypothetical protein